MLGHRSVAAGNVGVAACDVRGVNAPQQPGYGAGYGPQYGAQQYGGFDDGPGYPPQQQGRRAPEPAPRRRRVWPWVLLAVFLVPILGFAACTAMVGGAISAVDQARQGGTVAIGETYTYQGGLALSVAQPSPYNADNEFLVGAGQQGYEALVTVTNGTDAPVAASLVTMNATVNNAPAEQVFDESTFTTQDIAPGQALVIPFRFKVAEGTTGALQIAVAGALNEPVFFTGQLG